jgi:ribosome-associated translation inhibitor RaiA
MTVNDIEVVLRGAVPDTARALAEETVTEVARYSRDPILHARVKLTQSGDAGVARPLMAQANLDVNGRMVRAQVAAKTAAEGIDLLEDKLRRVLVDASRDWEARRGGRPTAEPHQWRHGSQPTERPNYFPRPVDEREVVRHKTYDPSLATPDEAAFDLDLMDFEFRLFTDLDTGQDSVIYRGGPTGYRLAQLAPDPDRSRTTAVPLTVSGQPAPTLSLAAAIERLNTSGLPFLFYADESSGRGHALYRRYDGHYGLIIPSA